MSNSVNRRKPHAHARTKTAKRTSNSTARKIKSTAPKKWSGAVGRKSDALDLEQSIFQVRSAARIAHSLKKSAESSRRRKAGPYQSAMSMLNFYVNRGGSNLSAARKRVLQQAKDELRKAFHRED
jgi:Protein of unknown function (DUF3175)